MEEEKKTIDYYTSESRREMENEIFKMISENWDKSPDKILYHYTTINGLLGIFKSNSLWCSNTYYLNDYSETVYSTAIINDVIEVKKNYYKDTYFNKILDEALLNIKAPNVNIYTLSFSENGDLLSQWRSYSDNGNGYALGMTFQNINLLKPKIFYWPSAKKVLYNIKEQFSLVDRTINVIYNYYKRIFTSIEELNQQELVNAFTLEISAQLIEFVTLFKHYAFEEEKEWRVTQLLIGDAKNEILEFRPGYMKLIPYIELFNVPSSNNKIEELIINEIVTGPMMRKELREKSLSMLMKKYSKNFNITYSNIPLCY